MAESYPNRSKTLWEREKLLGTSNFSFSHSVFKRHVSQGRQKVSLCGKVLNRKKINEQSRKRHVKEEQKTVHLGYKEDLTLYYIIPTFDNPKKEGSGKRCGKRRKCCFKNVFYSIKEKNHQPGNI